MVRRLSREPVPAPAEGEAAPGAPERWTVGAGDAKRPRVETAAASGLRLSDGLVAVVKRDCPTWRLVAPVLAELAAAGAPLTVYSQDDPDFPPGVRVVDDRSLEVSYRLQLTTAARRKVAWVPTIELGDFYSGTRTRLAMDLNLRLRPGLIIYTTTEYNHVDLPEGSFILRLFRVVPELQRRGRYRMDYSGTTQRDHLMQER